MSDQVPAHWPSNLQYLRKPVISRAIDANTRLLLAPQGVFCKTIISRTCIKTIKDPNHPAHGQYGLFAAKDLSPSELIVDYMGYIHLSSATDSDASSDYDLSLRHGTLHLGIDAARMGNESRMVNDYRAIQTGPNAKFDTYVTDNGEVRMGIFVLGTANQLSKKKKSSSRGIKKSQEILVSYGKGFWSHRGPDADSTLTGT